MTFVPMTRTNNWRGPIKYTKWDEKGLCDSLKQQRTGQTQILNTVRIPSSFEALRGCWNMEHIRGAASGLLNMQIDRPHYASLTHAYTFSHTHRLHMTTSVHKKGPRQYQRENTTTLYAQRRCSLLKNACGFLHSSICCTKLLPFLSLCIHWQRHVHESHLIVCGLGSLWSEERGRWRAHPLFTNEVTGDETTF